MINRVLIPELEQTSASFVLVGHRDVQNIQKRLKAVIKGNGGHRTTTTTTFYLYRTFHKHNDASLSRKEKSSFIKYY